MRHHFLAALLIFPLALMLGVTETEFILLSISICFVLFAELMNTAVEAVVDLVTTEYHPLAKTAKDVAAGAVLVASVGAVVMGYLILSNYIFPVYKEALDVVGNRSEMGAVVSLLAVVIIVIFLKSISGKGSPLEGGLPSGHAAIAFSVATLVSVSTRDPFISILAVMLAAMVSHSRLLLHIHTMREVILGAVAGTGITLFIMYLFRFIADTIHQ